MSFMKDMAALFRDDIINPARISPTIFLPRVRFPMNITRAMVIMLAKKAKTVIMGPGSRISIARVAPVAAPLEAPSMSGAARGF
jgi:hypothetical protein